MKSQTPTQAIDVLIGDEEQNRKQNKEENERNKEWDHGPFSRLSWIIRWAYSETAPSPTLAHKGVVGGLPIMSVFVGLSKDRNVEKLPTTKGHCTHQYC